MADAEAEEDTGEGGVAGAVDLVEECLGGLFAYAVKGRELGAGEGVEAGDGVDEGGAGG